jgi:3'-phosphoadenosine 5'-phosphosulfate sulfotransferase (PAPS reductase)/FAD synthetase
MSKEMMVEYDKVATVHFEEKKRYDKLKDKEASKYHENLFKKYDMLAFKEMDGLNINELYNEQVSKENTRALRSVRYFHYRNWKTATLNEKERWGIELVKMALQRSKKPVVSCSFGIDSIVTIYLVRKALVELGRDPSDIDVVWNDTKNEFQDVRRYAKQITEDWNLRLLVTAPKKVLKKVIDAHGGVDSSYFFTRKGDRRNGRPLSEKCCGVLKHEPMKRAIKENNWDLQINGIRSDESTQRLRANLRDGEYFYSSAEWKAFSCKPIAWWNDEDVWEYVEKESIPYNDLYDKNLIQVYPQNLESVIHSNEDRLTEYGFNINSLKEQQVQTVTRKQSILLEKLGFKLFTPRTGCQMCPIPVRFGYMQWMRLHYPKVFDAMVHNLGYGKALLEMIPEEAKVELKEVFGIDLNEENAHEFLQEVLQAKPCVFDKF